MVATYTQLLAERYKGKLDENADKYIHYAVDGALRMRALVRDLLLFSRVGRSQEAPQATDCNLVLQSVIANLQQVVQETGARISYHDSPVLLADQLELLQLFQNLIGNAIKFRGAAPPDVRVTANKKKDRVAVLSPRQRHRPRDLQENRGTQPGAHLGGISARPGIHIPVYLATCQRVRCIRFIHRKLIPKCCDILGGCKRRYNVSSVTDGEEAMSFLCHEGKYSDAATPDLVVLDLSLPRKDGRAVLKQLKSDSRFSKIPVVVFTTSQASSDITSSYELGANCYIQKPVDFDQFRNTVKSVGFYWLLINQAPVTTGAAKAATQP